MDNEGIVGYYWSEASNKNYAKYMSITSDVIKIKDNNYGNGILYDGFSLRLIEN
jgi:hypothetical protein